MKDLWRPTPLLYLGVSLTAVLTAGRLPRRWQRLTLGLASMLGWNIGMFLFIYWELPRFVARITNAE